MWANDHSLKAFNCYKCARTRLDHISGKHQAWVTLVSDIFSLGCGIYNYSKLQITGKQAARETEIILQRKNSTGW